MQKLKAIIDPRKGKEIAFWESLIDVEDTPTKFLKAETKVTVIQDDVSYGGNHRDKEYCKIQCTAYGSGYVLKDSIKLE